jgi:hypothetical protein
MAIEFKIEINSLMTGKLGDLDDVVKQVQYTVTAFEDKLYMSSVQTANLTLPEKIDENFTNFKDLTQEQVLGWLEGLEQTRVVKEYLRDQLSKKIEETKLEFKRAPWAPIPPEIVLPENLPPAPVIS